MIPHSHVTEVEDHLLQVLYTPDKLLSKRIEGLYGEDLKLHRVQIVLTCMDESYSVETFVYKIWEKK